MSLATAPLRGATRRTPLGAVRLINHAASFAADMVGWKFIRRFVGVGCHPCNSSPSPQRGAGPPSTVTNQPYRCKALSEGEGRELDSGRLRTHCASRRPARSQSRGADATKGMTAGPQAHRPQDWHQTGTSVTQKAKKSAGANLLTFAFLGSSTWARTRDLRINSPALYQLSYRGTAYDYSHLLLSRKAPISDGTHTR